MSGHWEVVKEWVEDDEREDDDFDLDDEKEREYERLSQCTCGAYVWNSKLCRLIHIADCCCGNT